MKLNNKLRYLTVAMLLVFCLSSCLKKEFGDYKYDRVPDVALDGGLQDFYLLNVDDELILKPDLSKAKISAVEYDFQWYYYPSDDNSIAARVIVGNAASIKLKGDMPTGNYYVVLEATNKSTGVKYFNKIKLLVKRLTSEGWLLLTYKDNHTNLSIVTTDNFVLKDFLVHSKEYPITEKPLELICMNDWDAKTQPIAIRTAKPQIYFIDYNTFEVHNTASDLFERTPTVQFDFFGSDMYFQSYYLRDTNGNMYTTTRGRGDDGNYPGGFRDAMLGDYVAAPMLIPTISSWPIQVLGFDVMGKKFVYQPTSTSKLTTFQPAGANAVFDMSNFNDEIIYGSNGNGPSSYVVGKKGDSYHVYEMQLDKGLDIYPAITKWSLVSPNGIAPKFFAASGKFPILYFIAGQDLYAYMLAENRYEKLYTFPANEKVGTLKMFRSTITYGEKDIPSMENRLCIAANADNEGLFYTFDLSATGELKTGSFSSRTGGFSPIVDIAYKEQK